MDALIQAPQTQCVSKAALAAGTTTTFTTTGATVYCIKGKAYTTNAATNAATPTTDVTTGAAFVPVPINYGCAFVFGYDGSSTTAATAIKVAQGGLQPLDSSGNFINAPQFPEVPDTVCPFAYLIVKVGSTGSAWTFGSSNLAGPPTGVTLAFQDLMTMPGRPQVS